MEYKTDALLIRTADYGEYDKMVTLFTAERGKISACMKGVRKAGAKLKFAAQPFCFAEYVLAERSGRNTVVSASLHDGFYPLRESVESFYAAAAVAEACDKLLYEGMVSGGLLVCAVNALKGLSEGEGGEALVRFLLSALALAGYPVEAAERCPVCGKALTEPLAFDMGGGAFACRSCIGGVPASVSTYRTIGAMLAGGRPPEGDGILRALRLLKAYFFYQTENELPALREYLALVR